MSSWYVLENVEAAVWWLRVVAIVLPILGGVAGLLSVMFSVRADTLRAPREITTPQRQAAVEHLDFAIKEFREMKMQPSLERALKHKELLKA